jgi:RNase H-fold protein (predicted Holliday junction resolvase)
VTRILGFNVGDRRIGLAIADPTARTRSRRSAAPTTRPRHQAAIERVIERKTTEIVGLPLDMSGEEGAAGRTRARRRRPANPSAPSGIVTSDCPAIVRKSASAR